MGKWFERLGLFLLVIFGLLYVGAKIHFFTRYGVLSPGEYVEEHWYFWAGMAKKEAHTAWEKSAESNILRSLGSKRLRITRKMKGPNRSMSSRAAESEPARACSNKRLNPRMSSSMADP